MPSAAAAARHRGEEEKMEEACVWVWKRTKMGVMFREGETQGKEEGALAAFSFAVAVNGAVTCGRRKRKRSEEGRKIGG